MLSSRGGGGIFVWDNYYNIIDGVFCPEKILWYQIDLGGLGCAKSFLKRQPSLYCHLLEHGPDALGGKNINKCLGLIRRRWQIKTRLET